MEFQQTGRYSFNTVSLIAYSLSGSPIEAEEGLTLVSLPVFEVHIRLCLFYRRYTVISYHFIKIGTFHNTHTSHVCSNRQLLIRIVGGGVQLVPLGTSATNWPVALAPGDYDDEEFGGMMIGRRNRNTRRKPAPVPLCPPQIPHDLTGRETGPPRWEASD
jgi:hypothetical protein